MNSECVDEFKEYRIVAELDYAAGYLRTGHYEVCVSGAELKEFCNMSRAEKEEFIGDNGEMVIDDYDINDHGDIGDIKFYEDVAEGLSKVIL